jgi:hypothetical protein
MRGRGRSSGGGSSGKSAPKETQKEKPKETPKESSSSDDSEDSGPPQILKKRTDKPASREILRKKMRLSNTVRRVTAVNLAFHFIIRI